MPIIKHIAIHKSPLNLFHYIVNGDKTDEMKYVTGWNCSENPDDAYEEFRDTFEYYSGERFYKKSVSDGKNKILLHHYIQSFAPGEISPEEAHQIGISWARQVFGNNHQFLVSTHIDKGHIHNHIAASVYRLDGKHSLGIVQPKAIST